MSETNGLLRIPAREAPIPAHLSPMAQAQLAKPGPSNPPWPAQDDIAAWRELIARMDQIGGAGLSMMAEQVEAEVEEIDAGGVRVFVVTLKDAAEDDARIYMDVHGGALLWGGGESCRAMGLITAGAVGARVWAVDYRMPPDHPYPAAVDDCVAAYRALLKTQAPQNVIIGGASAGGNIAAASILKARDQGLPLPAGCVLISPELDLTESGDTFQHAARRRYRADEPVDASESFVRGRA